MEDPEGHSISELFRPVELANFRRLKQENLQDWILSSQSWGPKELPSHISAVCPRKQKKKISKVLNNEIDFHYICL